MYFKIILIKNLIQKSEENFNIKSGKSQEIYLSLICDNLVLCKQIKNQKFQITLKYICSEMTIYTFEFVDKFKIFVPNFCNQWLKICQ